MNSEVVEQDRQMVEEEGWTDNGHEQVMETNSVIGFVEVGGWVVTCREGLMKE